MAFQVFDLPLQSSHMAFSLKSQSGAGHKLSFESSDVVFSLVFLVRAQGAHEGVSGDSAVFGFVELLPQQLVLAFLKIRLQLGYVGAKGTKRDVMVAIG